MLLSVLVIVNEQLQGSINVKLPSPQETQEELVVFARELQVRVLCFSLSHQPPQFHDGLQSSLRVLIQLLHHIQVVQGQDTR